MCLRVSTTSLDAHQVLIPVCSPAKQCGLAAQSISSLSLVAGTNDVSEGILEGGTSDEEAVDVRLGNELGGVLVSDATTVKDAGLLGGLSGDIRAEPGSQVVVSLLGLLGRGSHTGANGPHGLVSNDNLAPVIDLSADGLQLSCVDGVGLAGLALVQLLANAGHDAQVLLKSDLDLLGDNLVGLTEDVAALAVTKDDPVQTEVLDHGGAGLAGVCTVAVKGAVLGGQLDLGASEGLLGSANVEERGGDDNLDLALVEAEGLQHVRGEGAAEFGSAIALPVASDEKFA